MAILDSRYEEIDASKEDRAYLRKTLVRDRKDEYHAWMVAALSPWAIVPCQTNLRNQKSIQSRASAVARDSLRAENKITSILNTTVRHYESVSKLRSAFLRHELGDTLSETRLKLGNALRAMGIEWRLCFLQAMIVEIMQGAEPMKSRKTLFFLTNVCSLTGSLQYLKNTRSSYNIWESWICLKWN